MTATETPKTASKIGNNSFSLLLILNLNSLENPKPLKNPNKIDTKKLTLSFFITWHLRFIILSIDIANKLEGIKNLIISKFVFTSKEILKIKNMPLNRSSYHFAKLNGKFEGKKIEGLGLKYTELDVTINKLFTYYNKN